VESDEHTDCPPSHVLEEIESESFWRLKLYGYLSRKLHLQANASNPGNANKVFFDQNDKRVTWALKQLQAAVTEAGSKLVVVSVASAYSYKNETTRAAYEKTPIRLHLTKILDELDIPHIEMLHELPKHVDFSEIYDRYFVKRENGSLGHPSAIQHQRMAEIIYEKICSLPGPNKPGC